MDAPIYGGAWVEDLWSFPAWTGQSVCHCSEQEPRASQQDEAPFTLSIWLREAVQDGLISPTFVTTQEMTADIFTKALDWFEVLKCSELGLFP